MKLIINLHIFTKNKKVTERTVRHAPRIDDEIRLNDDEFYKVTKAVWCYDENEHPCSRMNVEVVKLKV